MSLIAKFPEDWQKWLRENIERNCSTASIIKAMVEGGGFNIAEVAEVVAELTGTSVVDTDMPKVNIVGNKIKVSDREINVLAVHHNPTIIVLGNVLSDDECEMLIQHSESKMNRSPVVGEDGSSEIHPGRTSEGAMLQRSETIGIGFIEDRLAEIANWPVERGEGMQVLRYGPGNEYRAHYDWFNANTEGGLKHMERGGQRLGTFVLYLNDVEAGGATSFPRVGIEVMPKKGNAVFFINTDGNRAPDANTLHAGTPVVEGVKYVANKWLRERTF